MAAPLIATEHLSVRLQGVQILENVSISVSRGEIVTLIGPNGSGKTTLLKALLGMVAGDGVVRRVPGLRIGYVPQHFARDRSLPMTAIRFLRLYAAQDAADEALDRTGATQARDRQLASLSGGEMARVLLARAIAGKPDLLVLDEPLAGVDVTGEAALYHLIAQIRDRLDCGVLLVSHDLHFVMAQASRVICLNGHVCCEGHAQSVLRDPAFAQLFGPRAAAELALYAHHHDHTHDGHGHDGHGHDGHSHE